MKLVDLDPTWLLRDGKRVGFTFHTPTPSAWSRTTGKLERQSCFPQPPSISAQVDLFDEAHDDEMVQPCNSKQHWQIAGGIDTADFETMTVTPSLDGSAGGLWHGFITNGEIVGGI